MYDTEKMPKKGKKVPSKGNLAPEGEIIQKVPESYKSRYKDSIGPKKDIVQEYVKPTYDSRYS